MRSLQAIFGNCVPLLLLVAGCGPAGLGGPAPPVGVAGRAPAGPDRGRATVFDFGTILAGGQVLSHEFTLANEGSKTLRLIGAKAESPCCSSVGPHPDEIPAGSAIRIPTRYRPGFNAGRRGAHFSITTDSAERPEIRLSVVASLVPEVEVVPLEGPGIPQAPGGPSRQSIRVISRRVNGSGREAPSSVEAAPPLTARFEGAAVVRASAGGVVESTRDVVFEIPGGTPAGRHRQAASIRWAGERLGPTTSNGRSRPR